MKRKIYGLITSALLISMGFTSCLKDSNIDDQDYGLINLNANKIIEIPGNVSHEKSLVLLSEGIKDVTIGEVRLAAENPASEDIVVSLTTSKTTEIIGDSPAFPLDQITVPATVTIKKGERSGPLIVKINTSLLSSEPQYAALSITSVDKTGYVISGNFDHLILNMKVRHKYEGRYSFTGSLIDSYNTTLIHIAATYTANSGKPYTVQLQTKDGHTLMFYDELTRKDYIYPLATASGSYSAYGSFCPEFTFDDNGNVTKVANYYVNPDNTRSAEIDPAGVNKYDPATKSFTVSYWMNQPSVIADPPYHRTHITETYKFAGDL